MKITQPKAIASMAITVGSGGVVIPGDVVGGGDPITLTEFITLLLAGGGPYLRTTLGGVGEVQDLGDMGASATIDLANANKFDGMLTDHCSIATTGWTPGKDCWIVVQLTQDGTGGWVASFAGVTWDNGLTPTPSTAADTTAFYLLHSDDGGLSIYGWLAGGGGSSDGMVPYLIEFGETFTVPVKKQALWKQAIHVDAGGTLAVAGSLLMVT